MGILDPFFDVGNNEANLKAVYSYFQSTPVKTDQARKIKSDFLAWYSSEVSGSFFGGYSRANVEEAYNRRNAFNLANEIHDQKALEFARTVQTTGITEEQALGRELGSKRDIAGNYPNRPGVTALSAADGTILPGARPTIRYGSTGPAVEAWQTILGITADGKFGPQTRSATMDFQRRNGLVVDGIVGSATWGAALKTSGDMSIEEAATTYVTPTGTPTRKARTGEIIPIQNIKRPAPTTRTISRKQPAIAKAASQKADQVLPIKTAGLGEFPDAFNNLPWYGKLGVVLGGSSVAYYLTKDFGKPSKKYNVKSKA